MPPRRRRDRSAGRVWPPAASRCRTRPLPPAIPPPPRPCCALKPSAGAQEYRDIAEDTLASFAGIVEHFGLYAGSYGLALSGCCSIRCRWSSSAQARRPRALRRSPWPASRSTNTVMRIAPERLVPGGLPEALAETLLQCPAAAGCHSLGAGLPRAHLPAANHRRRGPAAKPWSAAL